MSKPVYHQSDLEKFELCAHAYYLEKIRKKRGFGSFYSCRGSAVHEARSVNLTQKIKTGRDLACDDLCDAARDEIRRQVNHEDIDLKSPELDGLGKKNAAGKIIDGTLPLVRLDHEQLQPYIQPLYVERSFELHLPQYPFDVAGRLDTFDRLRVLIDAKTSKQRWSQAKADSGYQPPLYSLGIRAMTGSLPSRFEYHILVGMKTKRLAYKLEVEVTEARIRSLMLRFEMMHKSITNGVFQPCQHSSWKCSPTWCSHYRYCKYV